MMSEAYPHRPLDQDRGGAAQELHELRGDRGLATQKVPLLLGHSEAFEEPGLGNRKAGGTEDGVPDPYRLTVLRLNLVKHMPGSPRSIGRGVESRVVLKEFLADRLGVLARVMGQFACERFRDGLLSKVSHLLLHCFGGRPSPRRGKEGVRVQVAEQGQSRAKRFCSRQVAHRLHVPVNPFARVVGVEVPPLPDEKLSHQGEGVAEVPSLAGREFPMPEDSDQ